MGLVALPQLSLNLLMMSLLDRYACTLGPVSHIRRLLRLKMVPWAVVATVVVSCVMSLYAALLNDVVPGFGCTSTNATLNAILYIGLHGMLTPCAMLILTLLTYRNVSNSRKRVGVITTNVTVRNGNRFRNQFIATVFVQVFVSSFFVLQWIVMYWYFLATLYDNRTAEQWLVIYFSLGLTNNLYYVVNVKSFYLSTLTSRLFRETLIAGVVKLLPGHVYRRWNRNNQTVTNTVVRFTK
ncbi:unnamed protein product [Adineta ricciae]|uniref:G-protein coupled receptors family 1 profile domain-containing protein n=1 Tax=Adineta ricciae TaxID=249248 RepID=A0A816GTM2_ADIRI|nr:unnamed protein product [Adineta ricciae]